MAKQDILVGVGVDTSRAEAGLNRFVAQANGMKSPKINVDASSFTKARQEAVSFERALDNVGARIIAFGAIFATIQGVQRAFRSLVTTTIEVESSIANIQVVLQATTANLDRFSKGLFDVARNTGQSFKDVASAATEFARQGLSVEETLKRTNDAFILTRLSGLDYETSVAAITATLNSFNKEVIDSTTLVNRLANVDGAFAVSSADLANALSRVGNSAQEAGVDFNELIAVVTALQQRTARGGAVIGNSLKTIFTRTSRAGVREELENIGVATTNVDGSFRDQIDVLTDLAKTYDTLGDSQKAYVSELVGGVFQINQLKALVADLGGSYSIYESALRIANGTTDEAIVRNAKLNETLQTIINTSNVNTTELFSKIGAKTVEPILKDILNSFNSVFESVGKSDAAKGIGNAILDSIRTVVQGPGAVVLIGLILKFGKQFGGLLARSLKDLLTINTAARQIASTQNVINAALQNASATDLKRIANLTSIEARNKAILSLIQQQNAAAGAAGIRNLGAAAALSGQIRVNRTRSGGGFVPNYAGGGGLSDAVAREIGAGIRPSQIRISSSPRLVGARNPLGLGVSNVRDEPLGLSQGINRAVSQGMNPRFNGMVPNFVYSERDERIVQKLVASGRLAEATSFLLKKDKGELVRAVGSGNKKTTKLALASKIIDMARGGTSAVQMSSGVMQGRHSGTMHKYMDGANEKAVKMAEEAARKRVFAQSPQAQAEKASRDREQSEKKLAELRQRSSDKVAYREKEINKIFEKRVGLGWGFERALRKLKISDSEMGKMPGVQDKIAQSRQQIASNRTTGLFAASFAIPIVAEMANSMLSPKGDNVSLEDQMAQQRRSAIIGATGQGLGVAAMAAMIPGGLLPGLAIGGTMAAYNATNAMINQAAPDAAMKNRAIDERQNKRATEFNTVAQVAQTQGQVEDMARSGDLDTRSSRILGEQMETALQSLPVELRNTMAQAMKSGGPDGLQKAMEQMAKVAATDTKPREDLEKALNVLGDKKTAGGISAANQRALKEQGGVGLLAAQLKSNGVLTRAATKEIQSGKSGRSTEEILEELEKSTWLANDTITLTEEEVKSLANSLSALPEITEVLVKVDKGDLEDFDRLLGDRAINFTDEQKTNLIEQTRTQKKDRDEGVGAQTQKMVARFSRSAANIRNLNRAFSLQLADSNREVDFEKQGLNSKATILQARNPQAFETMESTFEKKLLDLDFKKLNNELTADVKKNVAALMEDLPVGGKNSKNARSVLGGVLTSDDPAEILKRLESARGKITDTESKQFVEIDKLIQSFQDGLSENGKNRDATLKSIEETRLLNETLKQINRQQSAFGGLMDRETLGALRAGGAPAGKNSREIADMNISAQAQQNQRAASGQSKERFDMERNAELGEKSRQQLEYREQLKAMGLNDEQLAQFDASQGTAVNVDKGQTAERQEVITSTLQDLFKEQLSEVRQFFPAKFNEIDRLFKENPLEAPGKAAGILAGLNITSPAYQKNRDMAVGSANAAQQALNISQENVRAQLEKAGINLPKSAYDSEIPPKASPVEADLVAQADALRNKYQFRNSDGAKPGILAAPGVRKAEFNYFDDLGTQQINAYAGKTNI